MFCSILSTTIVGVDAVPVSVEADVSDGMPSFTIVGCVSAKVREAQDRVRTAMKHNGISFPPKRITLNLAPGDLKKDGTRFDLPIAAAILSAIQITSQDSFLDYLLLGELHLDGRVEAVSGVLPSVICARSMGLKGCLVPKGNYKEACFVEGIKIVAIRSLEDLILFSQGRLPEAGTEEAAEADTPAVSDSIPDFSDIRGQKTVKRACLIAAAGFHNILLSGPPGSGKSMAARRLPGILPDLTSEEQLEISRIYSVSGLLNEAHPLITARPFRSPHHSLSSQALCGGGRDPKPGEITLAHRGVLYIDELPEMSPKTLEHLRSPLEDRWITICRTSGSFRFPASFLFAASMNPCPCGYYPDAKKCTCSERDLHRYQQRISQPILDRIDIKTEVPSATYEDLTQGGADKISSAVMRKKVCRAFSIQEERYASLSIAFNSELPAASLKQYCRLSGEADRTIRAAFKHLGLSARGYHKILKVARTIADLEESELIGESHISEAICFRSQFGGKEHA